MIFDMNEVEKLLLHKEILMTNEFFVLVGKIGYKL